MTQLRTMEIDFDIHKLIESERRGFDEPPYVALRRLLNLPDIPSEPSGSAAAGSGRSWEEDGVELPHGTLVRMEYDRGRQVYEGKIIDGKWHVNGRVFASPSGAASGLAITRKGTTTRLNGWMYWQVNRPGDTKWKLLNDLHVDRRRERKGIKAFELSDF